MIRSTDSLEKFIQALDRPGPAWWLRRGLFTFLLTLGLPGLSWLAAPQLQTLAMGLGFLGTFAVVVAAFWMYRELFTKGLDRWGFTWTTLLVALAMSWALDASLGLIMRTALGGALPEVLDIRQLDPKNPAFPASLALLMARAVLSMAAGLEFLLAFFRLRFQVLETREQALRAHLAPHFLFNTLNVLHAQIEQDPKGAQATTEKLAALLRRVVELADTATVPLRDELAFVENYLGIEKARLGERLRLHLDIPEEAEAFPVPPLSVQVLVENAVKHGVGSREQGGEVRIGAAVKGRELQVWVEDPGTGASQDRGTGTALARLRLQLEKPGDLQMGMVDGRHRVGFRWSRA